MSATAWFIIAIVGFSLSGIALVVAIFMFIKMNIPAIIGDLTGKTVAREIKAMRDANILSGDKRFRPSKVNLERGTLTERVDQPSLDAQAIKKAHASKRLDKTTGQLSDNLSKKKGGTVELSEGINESSNVGSSPTESLSSTATEVLSDNNVTEILSSNATEILDKNATEILKSDVTELLSDDEKTVGGTTVLSQTEELKETEVKPVAFKTVKSELVIHSDEVIWCEGS